MGFHTLQGHYPIVDGGNNLLKDVLFLLDEQGWHIV